MTNDPFESLEICCVTDAGQVRCTTAVLEAIGDLDEKRQAQLKAVMEAACRVGGYLPPEKFKDEGSFSTKDPALGDCKVYAFKCFQFRVYAARVHYQGVKTFVCLCVDPSKKQDRANQTLLRLTAEYAAPYLRFVKK